ncbi:MAG: peptide deformylase [Alphaproteobacteria bacterium]|nr:peptide deformylase [Alphaproteobacteria bacterium]
MPILKIARMGHPILNQRAEAVPDPTAPEVARLVAAMIETMEDADGTGLAAPQVHMPWRIVVYKVMAERAEAEEGAEGDSESEEVPTTALINPVIEPLGEETNVAFEACLSVPDMAGPVRRFSHIRLTYQTLAGETVSREAEGFHARVLQHECDHLDGVLYPMRVEDMRQFGFVDALGKGQGMPESADEGSEDSEGDVEELGDVAAG